jgi:hypothetical protein
MMEAVSTFETPVGLGNDGNESKAIKSILNKMYACYHAVQHLLSSRLISKCIKIKIYKL